MFDDVSPCLWVLCAELTHRHVAPSPALELGFVRNEHKMTVDSHTDIDVMTSMARREVAARRADRRWAALHIMTTMAAAPAGTAL